MYTRSLTIDAAAICTLECHKCARQTDKVPGRNGGYISVKEIEKLLPWYDNLDFCGQVSDPIFNPYLEDILSVLYKNNKGCRIITAATHPNKDLEWYKKCFESNPNVEWTFGIDGLPEESCMYRVNQDGEHLFEVMKMGSKMGLKMRWQYIVFSYNEHHIEEAYQMAKDNGIKFELMVSARFDKDDVYKPKNENYYRMRPWAS